MTLKIINFLLKGFGKTAQVKDYFEKFAAQYAWDNGSYFQAFQQILKLLLSPQKYQNQTGHDVITFKLRQEFDDEGIKLYALFSICIHIRFSS